MLSHVVVKQEVETLYMSYFKNWSTVSQAIISCTHSLYKNRSRRDKDMAQITWLKIVILNVYEISKAYACLQGPYKLYTDCR